MASGYTNYSGVFLAQSAAYKTTIWASGTATITAGATPTRLMANGKGNGLVGGSYDDTLGVNSLKDRYSGGGGVDTAIATVDAVLPSDIENLTMDASWSPVFGLANNSANIVKAVTANVTLDAKGGDDVIVSFGKKGAFLFEQGSGKDIVYNFHTGATDSDIVRLTGYGFDSFAEVTGAMTQTGTDVLLKLSASDLILFKNTTISAFTAQNFQLSIDPSKLKLTFAEEFNTLSLQTKSAGGGIWATSFAWDRYTTLSAHTIPSEQEVYVDPQFAGTGTTALGLNPFKVSNGVLTITPSATAGAVKSALWNYDYTSGLLTTKGSFAQQYGYFEMRADLPEAKGVFPAFWLLPADGSFTAEIDIMEYVGETNIVHNTVHYGPDGDHWVAPSFKSYVADLASGYHTFGLLWTAETLTWYVDGTQVAQIATPAEAKKPMYMLVNYAVGGDWAGDIAANITLPGMAIDYIRAYSLAAAPASSPTQGGSGADTLSGTAGAETLTGGAGNDTYTVGTGDTVVEAANGGADTINTSISYALGANVENLTLTGSSAINGTGNSLNNVITGNSAANVLTGGGGVDTLVGGAGDDSYVLNSASDTVIENAGGGTDTVNIGSTYVLTANVENLILTGSAAIAGTGNALNNSMVGNGAANTLTGLAGNDTLNGGAGIDRLVGGTGNDLYVLGFDADAVVEAASEGVDAVTASFSYTLGANVENLTLTGPYAISGTGNALNNVLTGNGSVNNLTGGDGADTLNGGAGNDRLVGGGGNDTYVLGSETDVVVEAAGQGVDTVTTNLTYALGAHVENLTLTGTWAAYGYGNDLANVLTGNDAANRLEGRAGADTLIAGAGADTLVGGLGDDRLTGAGAADTFIFNKGDGHDIITDFGNGADLLNLSSYLSAGYKPTLVVSGSDTLIQFSTGEYVRLLGVLPSQLTATSGGFIHV
ncbi:family 16 glycosylhydrolase [Phenylobacterium sp. LjRoot225]|uniref:family 16 glycosylhydrolase n=1 Tax=Phenylobacterium sp. LjRoot225 TaxID=3342285 RepID=UPI003ECDAD91